MRTTTLCGAERRKDDGMPNTLSLRSSSKRQGTNRRQGNNLPNYLYAITIKKLPLAQKSVGL